MAPPTQGSPKIYKDSKLLSVNKVLVTTNDLKDRTIRDLRTELMTKAQKIDSLKQRIKTLEADIAEFVNEFEKARLLTSKKSG